MKRKKVQSVNVMTKEKEEHVRGIHEKCTKEEEYDFLDNIDFLEHIDMSDYEGEGLRIEKEPEQRKEEIHVNVDYLDDLAFFDELDYFEELNKSLEEELKELDTGNMTTIVKTRRRWIRAHSDGLLLGAGIGVMLLLSGSIIGFVRMQLLKTGDSYAVTADTKGIVTSESGSGNGAVISLVKQEEEPVETPHKSESLIQKREQPKAVKTKETTGETKQVSEKELKNFFRDSVFIGNSLTEGLQVAGGVSTAKYLAVKSLSVTDAIKKPVIGSGSNKKSIPEALSQTECKKIFVMFGVNELGWPYPKIFGERYEKLLNKLKETQPEATIYVQSILPCAKWLGDQDKECSKKNIEAFNKVIEEAAKKAGCEYLDVGPAVAGKDGYLPEEAAVDGMHLKRAYNRKWISYIYEQLK